MNNKIYEEIKQIKWILFFLYLAISFSIIYQNIT